MTRFKAGLIGLFSLFLPLALAAEAGIAPGTDFKKIFNKSTIISSNVFSTRDNAGNQWITMAADTHVTTNIPLDKLRSVITDYEHYPDFFKRNTSSQVIGTTEDGGVYQRVRVTVGLMGFSYTCGYTVLCRETVNTPAKFVLTFAHVSDDGNTRDVYGEWYFETVYVEGNPWTYVRYVSSSASIRRLVLQKAIQSMFVNSEFTDMTDQLLEAARKYR
jgi:ribosome-associated toxin RatA of RatAB toxin-antitoxin module